MIRSMTGYGRVERIEQGRNIVVEVKSVNHRFLEVALRLPAALYPLEMEYKKKVAERFKRGRIDLSVRLEGEDASSSSVHVNLETARRYYDALCRLRDELHIEEPVRLKTLVGFRDIFAPPAETELDDAFLDVVGKTLDEALTMLVNMRQDEGIALYADMDMRLGIIEQNIDLIARRAPLVVLEYARRLADRTQELTAGAVLDEARLAQEVAMMADRSDITEEIVRMHSHIGQFRELLQSDEPQGRKIDFLLQEMNREINTIGSKSSDVEISRVVIDSKSELGKLREQAQNIE